MRFLWNGMTKERYLLCVCRPFRNFRFLNDSRLMSKTQNTEWHNHCAVREVRGCVFKLNAGLKLYSIQFEVINNKLSDHVVRSYPPFTPYGVIITTNSSGIHNDEPDSGRHHISASYGSMGQSYQRSREDSWISDLFHEPTMVIKRRIRQFSDAFADSCEYL